MPQIATTLHLTVDDYQSPTHWYWRLTDSSGHYLADHEVQLDPHDGEYEAFLDLPNYLRIHASPFHRRQDEAKIVRQLGDWMGRNFYGPIGDKILNAGTPAIVRLHVPAQPAETANLLYCPWELGHVQGQPLALQDVSLIFEGPGQAAPVKHEPVGDRLRILAVFSMPVDEAALNLRQERYELSHLIRAIGQQGHAIDLRVLQYGVTRDTLREILEDGEGWDMVHFSGHGLAAHLVLEKPDGTADLVPSHDLVKLLRPARSRLKWVTLSACSSAAATLDETLRWLGVEPRRDSAPVAGTQALQTVAQAMVQSLDCAVLAMRYPVGDQFAIDLGRCLFQRVLDKKQPLARALQLTLPELLEAPDVDAIAVATPTLFGRQAADLDLKLPLGEAPLRLGLAHFPDEPERFVGRVGLLSQARKALAPDSGYTGVLFQGMSGGGKTACALELAYQYEDIDRFQRFLWFKAPQDAAMALAELAREWEKQLQPEVSLYAHADRDTFLANLPRVTKFLEQRSVLLVLDNLETLQRDNGAWKDPLWEKLIAALLDHRGLSRVVLTSRLRPQSLHKKVLPLPVHSLTLNEAALLARQSPNLGKMLRDESERPLVIRTLKLVQGHPELLKLAEAQASTAERLTEHLNRAQTASDRPLEAFFRTGESQLDENDFLQALYAWTKSVSGSLPEPARLLFYRLCCLEEVDREKRVVENVWKDAATILPTLVDAALLDTEYRMHPGVAEAGRDLAGQQLRDAVDDELGSFWRAAFNHARENESSGLGGLVIRAGRSAAPYMMRQRRWKEAAWMLENVIHRDSSPAMVAEVLPLLQRIGTITESLEALAAFARTLLEAGRIGEAEALFRKLEKQAVELGQYRLASVSAGDLINLLRSLGRLEEALQTVDRLKAHTCQAGLGPWTQLADEACRLQILNDIGHYEKVLAAVQILREEMNGYPEAASPKEAVTLWSVKETLLDTGRRAALYLGRWDEALALNQEIVNLKASRGATPPEIAGTQANDYGPLLSLQRYPEARRLLLRCLAVFESNEDLGKAHSAFAHLEANLKHHDAAVRHENAALRYEYATSQPGSCAVSHFNLAINLTRTSAEPRVALAHCLAALLIVYQTGEGKLQSGIAALKQHLSRVTPTDIPATFDDLCTLVEQTEGVRFRDLFSRLPQRAPSGDAALQAVLALAAAEP